MLTITNQSDYGIIFISYLIGKKSYIPLSQMVEETKLPGRFLARIAASLVKNKIVESREGKIGGYKLTKKIEKMTLYDYLKIFEGDLTFIKCMDKKYNCPWEKQCYHKNFFQHNLYKIIVSSLKQFKLKDLFINLKG
ncbi:MAG: RrF2 family transcriptional regulator [Microgenomates group bacterium]